MSTETGKLYIECDITLDIPSEKVSLERGENVQETAMLPKSKRKIEKESKSHKKRNFGHHHKDPFKKKNSKLQVTKE